MSDKLSYWIASISGLFVAKPVIESVPAPDPFIRGRRRKTVEEARASAADEIEPEDPGFSLFGVSYPSIAATTGIALMGAMRSGKTVLLKMILRYAIEGVGPGRDWRLFVHEAKGDILPFVYGVNATLETPVAIYNMNPLAPDCVGWDICADVPLPEIANTVCEIFVPPQTGDSQFFSDAARQLMQAVMTSFILTNQDREERGEEPIHWTLRHVCLILQREEFIQAVIGCHPGLEHALATLKRQNNDVVVTMQTYLQPFATIAAAWQGKKLISLERDWLDNKDGSILVVGRNPQAKAGTLALNRVLFERVSQLILDSEDDSTRRTWFVLDEFPTMGTLSGMEEFVTNCRSKGGAIVLAFQNFATLVSRYTQELADTIMDEMQIKVWLKCDGKQAKFASDYVGPLELYEESSGQSQTQTGHSESQNTAAKTKPAVESTEFPKLKLAGPKNGISGFVTSSFFDGVYEHTAEWKEFAETANLNGTLPEKVKLKPRDQMMTALNDEEKLALGLVKPEEAPPQPKEEAETAAVVPPPTPEEAKTAPASDPVSAEERLMNERRDRLQKDREKRQNLRVVAGGQNWL